MSEIVTTQTENAELGDPEQYLAGAVPILLAAEPPWGSDAWFARYGSLASYQFAGQVREAIAAGVGCTAMAEIVGEAFDAQSYGAGDEFSTDTRAMIANNALMIYDPQTRAALAALEQYQDLRWHRTAEVLATLANVLDYISSRESDEVALKVLNFRPGHQELA